MVKSRNSRAQSSDSLYSDNSIENYPFTGCLGELYGWNNHCHYIRRMGIPIDE